jgi:isopenicillin N synthase-like dioxygenase
MKDHILNDYGFFYVPIESMNEIDNMIKKVKEYFNLPINDKLKQILNKDGLGYVPMNKIREGIRVTKESYTYIPNKIISPFEKEFNEYYNYASLIAKNIFLQLMSTSNIPVEKYIDYINPFYTTLSILHYPPILESNNDISSWVGISPHTDWGFITVLYTDNEGLEIFIDNEWVKVPNKPNHFIVNIGDMLELLSNGKYKSTLHRVINKSEKYTLALFFDPHIDNIIYPYLESNLYKPIKYDDYLKDKILETYKNKI